jgi:hypothetical protein
MEPSTDTAPAEKASKPKKRTDAERAFSTAGMNHAPASTLNPEQKEQLRRDNLQAGIHRGLDHLTQTYGGLSILTNAQIAEKLVEMVVNEESVRGR